MSMSVSLLRLGTYTGWLPIRVNTFQAYCIVPFALGGGMQESFPEYQACCCGVSARRFIIIGPKRAGELSDTS
jgi:hypothetical protein